MTATRLARVVLPALGLVTVNGCLIDLQRNLDYVLAPGALTNALRLPHSSVVALADFMARFFFG